MRGRKDCSEEEESVEEGENVNKNNTAMYESKEGRIESNSTGCKEGLRKESVREMERKKRVCR